MKTEYGRIRPYSICILFLLLASSSAQALNETDQIAGENLPGIFIEPQENRAPVELPGGPIAGTESPGGGFSLESPAGVIYDMERGLAFAQRDVSFTYREFNVRGDRGLIDYNTNEAILTGNLTVTVRGQVFKGKSLTFNLESGRWVLTNIETTFPPEFFPAGTVLEPIYIRKGTLTGTDDTARGSDFRFSSCDRDHYFIESKRLDFYRDAQGEPDRIVLKKNQLVVLGKKIAPLPLFVIALQGARARRSNLQPIVGQNSFDGFFVKTVYDLSATSKKTDSLLIDALQKRGLGLGFTRELAKGAGVFYLYGLSGKDGGRQIDSRITKRWQIKKNLTSNLNFQSTKDNQFSGEGSGTQNGDIQLNYNTERIQSDASLRIARNNSSFGGFESVSTTLQHRQNFGGGWSINADSLYAGNRSSSSFGGDSRASTLDNTFQVDRRARTFDTFLRAELHDDLTGQNQINGAYALERLPELGFSTDTDRLAIPFLGSILPGAIDLGFGVFNEPNTNQKLNRTNFDFRARNRSQRLLQLGAFESNLNIGGRFNQSFYSNNTARYAYDLNLDLQNTIGGLSFGTSYFKQNNLGFTPFQFDFLSPSESVDFIASYQPSKKFQLNLSTGRDLQNGYTRDIDARVQFSPSRGFYASVGATYSPEQKTFGDVIGNFRFARNPDKLLGGTLDLGVRYSPDLGRISRINTTLDLFATRKTRIQALTGYDGFARQIDFNQIRVSRDLHCFNLFATYDQSSKELRFDLALKAFPFVDTRLGIGQFGQGFDSRIGNFSGN